MASAMPGHICREAVEVNVLEGRAEPCDDVFMQWYEHPPTVSLGDVDIERMAQVSWRSGVTSDRWKLNLSLGDQCGCTI
jgi:hypothetical protein